MPLLQHGLLADRAARGAAAALLRCAVAVA
jgi:hypothetical protein